MANIGGNYQSSRNCGKAVLDARNAAADFVNCAPHEIVFGPSMTALTFHVARALQNSGHLEKGDNIVLDPISHGANVSTWKRLAATCGASVRWLPVHAELTCQIDSAQEQLAKVVDAKTKLVAMGAASNGVGTVHDIAAICRSVAELSGGNALRYVDAVHYAPHECLDVAAIGCDFLAASSYKFFAPHAGILFGRSALLQRLAVDNLEAQDDGLPRDDNCHMSRWEVGTQNYEALAGLTAAVDYIAGLGSRFGGAAETADRRARIAAGWQAISAHEDDLKRRFLTGVTSVKGLEVFGITDMNSLQWRTPTFAVAKHGLTQAELCRSLCSKGIWCTSGNHYAGFWDAQSKGLATGQEGMTRIGLLHYNTLEEVDRILEALDSATP
eukprot:TRINITY_DN45205_c0_g1_i1.p1 TRINITY_DN45205_c0_g1~~TRINITY_DN45205_c0_g1_i1.p1  ORF type:complete len:408 (-),score=72.65 TRINITY_DN45205_c0_g1_i1:847-1998(-)